MPNRADHGVSRRPAGSTLEAHRLYSVLDRRLAQHEFVADDYSIADIAIRPWVSRYEWQTVDLNAYANVKRWYTVIARRPAVQRGYKVPKDVGEIPMPWFARRTIHPASAR
jgi:GST-like protein